MLFHRKTGLNTADGAVHWQPWGSNTVTQVFVSYSRKDQEFVQRLVAALVAEKREVWLDENDIEPTAEWLKKIFENIEAADNFLFVISPDSVVSTYARKEIDHAALNNKRMVPILYKPVSDEAIPEAVAKYQRINFTGNDDFDGKFAKIIAALDTDLDWKQDHTRLLTRAMEWQRQGRDNSFLLRGRDLREAERWVATGAEKEPKPTALHAVHPGQPPVRNQATKDRHCSCCSRVSYCSGPGNLCLHSKEPRATRDEGGPSQGVSRAFEGKSQRRPGKEHPFRHASGERHAPIWTASSVGRGRSIASSDLVVIGAADPARSF
jgi:TIR domain